MKIFKTVLRAAVIALVVFVYGFLMLRVFEGGDPKTVRGPVFDGAMTACVNAEGVPAVYEVSDLSYLTPDGLFRADRVRYYPTLGRIEVTVRWNESAVRDLAASCGLPVPSCEPFVFELCDGNGVTLDGTATFVTASRGRYQFRRLVFEGADLAIITDPDEGNPSLFVRAKYINDTADTDEPLCDFVIYEPQYELKPISFGSAAPDRPGHGEVFTYSAAEAHAACRSFSD